jgi:hypothetical protein
MCRVGIGSSCIQTEYLTHSNNTRQPTTKEESAPETHAFHPQRNSFLLYYMRLEAAMNMADVLLLYARRDGPAPIDARTNREAAYRCEY